MKSRSIEMLDRSISAMISAIEIYNKPNFLYRDETFAILSINAWELLFKAKMLKNSRNHLSTLYVYEYKTVKSGAKGKQRVRKLTRSGNPFTHSIDHIAKILIQSGELPQIVYSNVEVIIEMRDSSIHFYNHSIGFSKRLLEVGTASLKNYVTLIRNWFDKDLSEYNLYLMPLSFIQHSGNYETVMLNCEEKNFLRYIDAIDAESGSQGTDYATTLSIDIRFVKSTVKEALAVKYTADPNDPEATKVVLKEEQIKDRYPLDYADLTYECMERYSDFKVNDKYHTIRKKVLGNPKYVNVRELDPGNPRSAVKKLYSRSIINILDKYYTKK